jgi:hypothetical protein
VGDSVEFVGNGGDGRSLRCDDANRFRELDLDDDGGDSELREYPIGKSF